MADLDALPDLEQSVAAFRAAFADLIAEKVNTNPTYTATDARLRVVAEWGDFIDGAMLQLQDDYTERRVAGTLRLGASRMYRVEGSPEGAQVGNVGDLATDATNGNAYIKASGAATTTGWVLLVSGSASLPSLAENNVWLGNASNVATATTRAGVDSTAVHVGTAGEIAGVGAVAPASGDYLLAEDVDNANAKIRVTAAQIAALGLTVSGVDHRAVRMDGTDGIQDSAVTIDDSGNMLGIGTINASGLVSLAAELGVGGALPGSYLGSTDLAVAGDSVLLGEVAIGDPGAEQGAIQMLGASFDAIAKISDFGGGRDALLIGHRHSTTDGANFILTRSNSDTSSHAAVTNGMEIGRIMWAGHDGTDYNPVAEIRAYVNDTVATDDVPGLLAFYTTPDGSNTPALALEIDRYQATAFYGQYSPATATQSPAGTTITIDWRDGNFHRVVMDATTGTLVFTLSNPVHGATYRILLVLNDDGESHDTSWPSNVFWHGGTTTVAAAPAALSTVGDATTVVQEVILTYNGTEDVYIGHHGTAETS